MAERRMFAKTIIDSDAFLDMPITARLLYYDLGMRADDDGFVNAPKKIMRITGASQDDMSILIAKKYIIPFENGIVVIKHWRIHNYIRKDTYTETAYTDQKRELMLDAKGAYTLNQEDGIKYLCDVTSPSRSRDESVEGSSTQVRLGKDSIEKDSIEKDSIEKEKKKEKRKKKSEMTIDDIPWTFISILLENNVQDELKEAFMYFILMRLKANSKFTEHALDLTIRKVRNMYPNNEKMQIACVNQSVEHGWLTLYELKDFKPMPSNNTASFATPVTLSIDEEDW